jgi:hypothetical protein
VDTENISIEFGARGISEVAAVRPEELPNLTNAITEQVL